MMSLMRDIALRTFGASTLTAIRVALIQRGALPFHELDRILPSRPELAGLFRERLDKTGLALIGTIRKDGTPRISRLEAGVFDRHLLLGGMWQSKKFLDLMRDPRCLVHTVVSNKGGPEGEAKLRGRVVEVTDPAMRERKAQRAFDATRRAVPPLLAGHRERSSTAATATRLSRPGSPAGRSSRACGSGPTPATPLELGNGTRTVRGPSVVQDGER